MFLQTVIKELN